MSNHYTGPFSFNLLASQDEVAVVHDGRVLLMKNPQIATVDFHYDSAMHIDHTLSGDTMKQSVPREIRVGIEFVATEWEDAPANHANLPQAVEDMTVEELLHAVNQKIDNREP